MAKINIQTIYIKKREELGHRRLFTWLNRDASDALNRLAKYLKKSQGQIIQELLLCADRVLTNRCQDKESKFH